MTRRLGPDVADAADKLDALAQGLSDLHEDVRALRQTVEARFDALDRQLADVDDEQLAEILRRLPAE